ncbi:MAG: tetratricopeptide repeat protein, partial [Bacteroidota bacterium]
MRKTALILLFTILYINKTEAQTSVLSVADSLLQSGNYIAAIEKLDSYYPQTFETLVKQGYIFQITGNYSKSISSYNEALSKGESVKVTQSLGKSYQLQGNANKAIELYEEVLEKDSTNLILKYNLAKIYTKERKSKDAIKLLNELIKADSLNPNYHYSLGKIHQNKGASGFMKSGNYFLSAFKVDSSHLKSIYELTKFYKKIHFKDSATLFINKGLKKYPESINFNQSKAKDLFYRKEYDSTLVYLKRLEDLNYKTMFTYKLYG